MYTCGLFGLLRVLALLPWSVLRWLGHRLGWILYVANGREKRNVLANLQIAYPHLRQPQRLTLACQVLQETALTHMEMPRIWRAKSGLAARIDDQGLPQVMRELVAQGRGLILAMPHLGNWEMISSAVDPDLPITGLYRPPRQPSLEPLLLAGRNNHHIQMVPITRSGLKALHSALKAGEIVAILPDQVPKSASAAVPAPFFQRAALTMVLLNRLARRHQTPVLFVWAKRLPTGRYQIGYFVADETIRATDTQVAATALNQAVERCIADCPAQYQWAYRRFKPVDSTQSNPYGHL